jgi:hypothetical protein
VSAVRPTALPRSPAPGKAQRKKELKKVLFFSPKCPFSPAPQEQGRPYQVSRPCSRQKGHSRSVSVLASSPASDSPTPPTDLEQEIEQLEASNSDNVKLSDLKAELEKINKKKEEYLKEHPEQRNLVYRRRRKHDPGEAAPEQAPPQRKVFNKRGLPRHPERSIYYDPVMNPYGVPPPGMPYLERGQYFPQSQNLKYKLLSQRCVQTK